jgi:hypothetical protein
VHLLLRRLHVLTLDLWIQFHVTFAPDFRRRDHKSLRLECVVKAKRERAACIIGVSLRVVLHGQKCASGGIDGPKKERLGHITRIWGILAFVGISVTIATHTKSRVGTCGITIVTNKALVLTCCARIGGLKESWNIPLHINISESVES